MKNVVFILGTGHCGSTLIDLVLGSHRNVFSLGEISKLDRKRIKGKEEFWTPKLLEDLEKHFRSRRNRIISWDYHRLPSSFLFENRKNFYTRIFDETKTDVLVDSSKKIPWIKRGVAHLKKGSIKPKIIYVKREPRAVINSYFKKYRDKKNIKEIIEFVQSQIIKVDEYYTNIFSVDKVIVQYEEFCKNPEDQAKMLCRFLDIEYNPSMLEYWKFDHFNISGNSGTNSLVQKYKGKEAAFSAQRGDFEHYNSHPLAIRLDDRWKTDLSKEELDFIERNLKIL